MKTRGVAAIALAALVGACGGGTPVTPSTANAAANVVPGATRPSVAGEWRIASTVSECSGLRDCFNATGQPASHALRLIQDGGAVTGILFNDNGVLTPVTGTVDTSGRLTLSGSTPWAGSGDCPGGYQLEVFDASFGSESVTGSFRVAGTAPNSACYPGTYAERFNITEMTRVSTSPAPDLVSGVWRGYLRLTSCDLSTGPCSGGTSWSHDQITISTSSTMSIRMPHDYFDVPGTLQGDRIVLDTGTVETTGGGVTTRWRVIESDLRRDALGRLSGSAVVRREVYRDGAMDTMVRLTFEFNRVVLAPR